MPITKDVVKFGSFVVTTQVCAHLDAPLAAHCMPVTQWDAMCRGRGLTAGVSAYNCAPGLPPDTPVIRRCELKTVASGSCAGVAPPRRTAIQ